MACITTGTVARSQSPAARAVTAIAIGIGDAMRVIDAYMPQVLFPIVGVPISQAPRVKRAEGIMREEQRSAVGWSQRQLHVIEAPAVAIFRARRKSALIGDRIDSKALRAGRKHIGDQALVPAMNLMIERPAVVRTPVPIEHLATTAGVPSPLNTIPQDADLAANALLDRRVSREVSPRAQQSHA